MIISLVGRETLWQMRQDRCGETVSVEAVQQANESSHCCHRVLHLHFLTSSAASSCDGGVRAQLDLLGQAGRVVNKTAAMICQYHAVEIT